MKNIKTKIIGLVFLGAVTILLFGGAGCQEAGTWVGLEEVKQVFVPELRVEDFRPANNSTNVSPAAVVTVRFSEPILADSITPASIVMRYVNPYLDPAQVDIHYDWFLLAGQRDLEIKPTGKLLSGELVEIILRCDFSGDKKQNLSPENSALAENVCYTAQFQIGTKN
jgi:hypothetical protein